MPEYEWRVVCANGSDSHSHLRDLSHEHVEDWAEWADHAPHTLAYRCGPHHIERRTIGPWEAANE